MSSGRSSKLIARRGSSDKGCQNTSGFKFLQPSFASNSKLMGCGHYDNTLLRFVGQWQIQNTVGSLDLTVDGKFSGYCKRFAHPAGPRMQESQHSALLTPLVG